MDTPIYDQLVKDWPDIRRLANVKAVFIKLAEGDKFVQKSPIPPPWKNSKKKGVRRVRPTL